MVRKEQQRKQDERRAARARDAALVAEQGGYEPPSRMQSIWKEVRSPVDDEAVLWLTQRYWRLNGRLVDFALTISAVVSSGGEWGERDLARVDIRHGHAHAHVHLADGNEGPAIHIHRLDTVDDLQPALAASVSALQDLARRLLEGSDHD